MLRGTVVILLGLLSAVQGLGQSVYFDNLYVFNDRGENIRTGGTVRVSDGYVNWNNGVFSSQLASKLSLFTIDFEGNLLNVSELPLIDTVREQQLNLLALDDTTFIALSFKQVITDDIPGDVLVRKMNRNAEVSWEQTHGDSALIDIPQMIIQTLDEGFVVVGQIVFNEGSNESADAFLMKLDSQGGLEWTQTYGGDDYESCGDVIQTLDGGFFLLGWTRSFGAGNRDFYLVKVNDNGQQEWQQTYGGGGEDVGYSLLSLFNGNYLLTGGGTNAAVTTSQGYLYEVTPSGQQIWHEVYASGALPADYLYKTIQIPSGELISCGLADNSVTGGNAGWLIKTTSSGELIWQRVFDKNDQTDLFTNVLLAPDGGFLLSGQAINEQTGSQDAWLLKVDSVGCTYPNCIVGIDEEEKTVMVDVWPNPVSEVLNIEKAASSGVLNISVFDLSGREILRFAQNDRLKTIDVSSWPSGIYVLNGMDEKGHSFSLKVVKQ